MATKTIGRQALLAEMRLARTEILDLACSLSPEMHSVVYLGEWCVLDLLAHLIGWDYTNIQAAREILNDQLPAFYEYHDRDWKRYNAILVAKYRQKDFHKLLVSCQESHTALMSVLQNLAEADLISDHGVRFRGWRVTIERLLRAEAQDERQHAQELRAFFG